jgi:hypothetical protein
LCRPLTCSRSSPCWTEQGSCDLLHVQFEEDLRPFYIDACGFDPVHGGLMELS